MDKNTNYKRQSSIELLRIIAMIGIFISHWSVHGVKVFNYAGQDYLRNTIFTSLHMLGKISVDIFVIITGYFSLKDKFEFKFKKIFSIVFQVLTYSILWFGIEIILYLTGNIEYDWNTFSATLFPFFSFGYWFMVVYLALLLFSPFLNTLINNITQKQHFTMLVGLFIMIFILSLIGSGEWYNFFGLFIFLYSVGAYLKKYGISAKLSVRNSVVMFAIFFLVSVLSIPILIACKKNQALLIEQNSFLVFGSALSLFLIFIQLKFHSKTINTISKTMFGIYLLHDGIFRSILWRLLQTSKYTIFSNPSELILNLLLSTIIIFGFGILFELLRINTLEKITNKLIDNILEKKQTKE